MPHRRCLRAGALFFMFPKFLLPLWLVHLNCFGGDRGLNPNPARKPKLDFFFCFYLLFFSLDVVFYVRLSARLEPTRFAAIARCAVRPSRRIQCGAPDQSTRPRLAPTVVDRARATVVARPKAKAKAHSPELKPEFQSPGTGGSNNDNGDRLKCLEVDSRTGTMGRKSKKNVFSVLLEIQYNFKKFGFNQKFVSLKYSDLCQIMFITIIFRPYS